jgi:uncharacterized iron-regulated membrane protein
VVDEVRFADYPVVAKLARWGIDGHMGVLFGWVNQLVLVAFGIGLITLIVLGYRMWWRRRPWIAANVEGYPVHVDHWPAVTRGSA